MKRLRAVASTLTYYVSPSGNDRWSGLRPEPSRRGNDGPFATVEAAQRAVRRLKGRSSLKQPVDICLRDGVYELERPMRLSPRDSGSRGIDNPRSAKPWGECRVTYRAHDGEMPILSGGRRITGWRREEHNPTAVWVTVLPEVKLGAWSFRQLWVNGQRRRRTCLPAEGFYRVDRLARQVRHRGHSWAHGDDRFVFAGDDLSAEWKNLGDVEVVVYNFWVDSRMRIDRVDPGKRVVVLDRPCLTNLLDDRVRDGARPGACYRVENVLEALGRPGEWYLDRPTGTLTYVPLPGEDPETAEVIAPWLDQILVIEGDSLEDDPVEGISFVGITFAHTEWDLTEGEVWAGRWTENRATMRSNLYFDPKRKRLRFGGMTFRQWQKRGLDEGSVLEDPRFVNPEAGDFRLKKGSPARSIGFVGFDTSSVGPRDRH